MKNIYGKEAFERFLTEKGNEIRPINHYFLEKLQEKQKSLSCFSSVCKLVPLYQFEIYSPEYAEEIGYKYYLNSTDILLQYKNRYFTASRYQNIKTYSLSLYPTSKEEYSDSFNKSDYGLENPPPRIGQATTSKMDNWLGYLLKIEEAKKEHIKKVNNNIQNSLNILASFGNEVKWGEYKKKGTIHRGKITYKFSINRKGYISEYIVFPTSLSNLVEFINLSDNQFYRQSLLRKEEINSKIMDIAADLTEKTMAERYHLLPEVFYQKEYFSDQLRDDLNFCYEMNYSWLSQLFNSEYVPNKEEA